MRQLVLAQGDIYALVSALLPFRREAVKDIVQETNLALLAESGRYDASKPFMPWAATFARHQVQRYLKNLTREKVLFSSEMVDKLADLYPDDREEETKVPDERMGLLERLRVCRAKLKESDRALLALFYDERLSVRRIAEMLKRSEEGIRVTLSDIRRKLGSCVRKLCRLDDAAFERGPRRAIDEALDCAAEDRRPSGRLLQRAAFECRAMGPDELREVLDELRMDALLRGGPDCLTALRRRMAFYHWLRLAAGLVVLLGGWAYARTFLQSAAKPVPEPAAESAVVDLAPAPAVAVPSLSKESFPLTASTDQVAVVRTVDRKGEMNMIKTQAVAAVAAALTVAAPVAIQPARASATPPAAVARTVIIEDVTGFVASSTSDPITGLEARDGSESSDGGNDLEARDSTFSQTAAGNLNATKPAGFGVILR